MTKIPSVKLNDGHLMPAIAFGTYKATHDEGVLAVKHAIDSGYRHIDTAYLYANESQVGSAIADKIAEGVVKREDLFVVTKLWNTFHEGKLVEYACRKSLANLGLDYIDLFLMHGPIGFVHRGDDILLPKDANDEVEFNDVDYIETWKSMEQLVRLGLVRSIGVSNFNSEQIQRVLDVAEIKPVNNQVEASPNVNQTKLINFCEKQNIVITAYTPLGRPNFAARTPNYLFDSSVVELGKKYGKTAAQVALRFLYQSKAYPIAKSVTKSRIEENINIFDFELTPEDMQIVNSYANNQRVVPMLPFKNHKYYPFNLEF